MRIKKDYRWLKNEPWGESLHETIHKEPQKFMYLATLETLKNYLAQAKEDLKDEINSPRDKEIYKDDIKRYEEEIKDLEEFVVNYERLQERYKFDKNMLKQIQQDWEDYNFQLFSDWNHLQAMIIGGTDAIEEIPVEERRLNAKKKEARKKEVQLRFKKLLK